MTEPTRTKPGPDPLSGILRRTRRVMLVEGVLRAFWPLFSLGCVVWAAVAFGLAEVVSRGQLVAVLVAATAGALWLLVRGLRRFRWPSRDAARSRVDEALPGRPLSALQDVQASGRDDAGAQAVWAAHMARMRRLAMAARPARADLRLASRDPWALRLMALVALIAAVVFARNDGLEGVGAALAPAGGATVASGPSFEGWAEPPAYTGRPTLYLPEVSGDAPVSLPQGSRIVLRVYGEAGRFELAEGVSQGTAAALTEAAPGIAAAEFDVTRSGSVVLRQGGAALGEWSFVMEPDLPPEIELTEPVERAVTGETRMSYVARDDHGVSIARAEMALDLPAVDRRHGLTVDPVARPALVVDLPLPMSGAGAEVAETLAEDFSKHAFAGLPVTLRLVAEDAIGQSGEALSPLAALPSRRFYEPIAAALVEQRRDLLWSPQNARRVTQVLRAVTFAPEGFFDNAGAYLITRTAIRRLAAADAAGPVPEPVIAEVTEALWKAALLLEEGSLGDAAERLERARERLSEALRDDASDEEIAQLMDELREATRDYMEQMAREAIERGETQSAEAPPPGQTMTQDQIQELMDRIQELSEQGRKAEAQALLDMLQQMLENMEMMLTEGGQGQGEGGQGQESMQGLADTLREQQGLADESFQQLQREFREGRSGQPGQGQGEGQPGADGQSEGGAPDAGELAQRQDALRELLEGLEQGLPGSSGEATREALREAERNMGEAADGLREGDTAEALDRQADVIDNLRDGMRQMAEDMQAEQGGEGQGAQDGQARADGTSDPLGRPMGARGGIGTNDSMLPDGDTAARARELLDEIRRRTGDMARPDLELDYLRRLLDRF